MYMGNLRLLLLLAFVLTNSALAAIQLNAPAYLRQISASNQAEFSAAGKGNYEYPASSCEGVDIYIIDDPVDPHHEDLKGKVEQFWNCQVLGPDCEQVPLDKVPSNPGWGHGTHVAIVAAGETYGVCKHATIISLSVGEDRSHNPKALRKAQALIQQRRAGRKGAVINMSLHEPVAEDGTVPVLAPETTDLVTSIVKEQKASIVVAAGNKGTTTSTKPMCIHEYTICVGALQTSGEVAHFSNVGYGLEIYAPGTSFEHPFKDVPQNVAGTSFSTPLVAGIIATWLGVDGPFNDHLDVRYKLGFTGKPWVKAHSSGHGEDTPLRVANLGLSPETPGSYSANKQLLSQFREWLSPELAKLNARMENGAFIGVQKFKKITGPELGQLQRTFTRRFVRAAYRVGLLHGLQPLRELWAVQLQTFATTNLQQHRVT